METSPKTNPLRGGDIDVSRAYNFIHFGDKFGAVGHGRNGLGSADLENGLHPCNDAGCRQDQQDLDIP